MGRTVASLPCNHDWMHVAGLVDKHLDDKDEYKWVKNIVKLCQQIYHKVCREFCFFIVGIHIPLGLSIFVNDILAEVEV